MKASNEAVMLAKRIHEFLASMPRCAKAQASIP